MEKMQWKIEGDKKIINYLFVQIAKRGNLVLQKHFIYFYPEPKPHFVVDIYIYIYVYVFI